MAQEAVKISIYINEADRWNHKPLHLEVLRMLYQEGCAGGTVLHAVAGFTGRTGVQTTSLVDAGGKLPLVIQFIDSPEHVARVMPILKKMAGHRLIIRESLEIEDPAG